MTITLKRSDLIIPENRQRKEQSPEYITQLATSIDETGAGLLHPPIVRLINQRPHLVAGECRIRAFEQLWIMGQRIRYAGKTYDLNCFPATQISELDDLSAFEAELEENVRRLDLTWQDRATATSRLYELRTLQASKHQAPPPTFASIADETGSGPIDVRERILVARHLADPDVAKASSAKEALKILKRKEELQKSKELGESVGATFNASTHRLLKGDCTELLAQLPDAAFDVILTDPPYGINAQDFGDSGGKAQGEHFYDDTLENWQRLMHGLLANAGRLAKPQAHMYLFCDIDNFLRLREMVTEHCTASGWKPFRTPLVWFNPSSQRAPWPLTGPQRKYQLILYAVKGNKPTKTLQPDVVTYASDANLNHQAQKPVELFTNLLRRSCNPGDSVLDPFCGTGTIFPAAHGLKVKATGIELDSSAYGIAVERLARLK